MAVYIIVSGMHGHTNIKFEVGYYIYIYIYIYISVRYEISLNPFTGYRVILCEQMDGRNYVSDIYNSRAGEQLM